MAHLFTSVILVFIFFHYGHNSLLKETFKKETNSNESDGVNVEVVNDDNNKEIIEDQNKVKEDENNVRVSIKNIYRPGDCGDVTKTGKVAVVHYIGWVNGKKFDTTIDPLKRYMPFEFVIGSGSVIKGFEEGMKEMCKGEQRKIVIPPELGYGSKGAGLIPGEKFYIFLEEIIKR